ncbi:MAG: hypothetical protein ACM3Q2_08120 [Syntrophothermus sp.]
MAERKGGKQPWKRRPEAGESRPDRKKEDSEGFREKKRPESGNRDDNRGNRRFDKPEEGNERRRYGKPDDRNDRRRFDKPGDRNDRKRFDKPGDRNDRRRFDKPDERSDRRRFDNPETGGDKRRSGRPGERDDRRRYDKPEGGFDKRKFGRPEERNGNRKFDSSGDENKRRRFDKPDERNDRRRYDKPEEGNERRRYGKPEEGNERRRFGKPEDRNDRRRFDKSEEGNERRRFGKPEEGNERRRFGKSDDRTERRRYDKPDDRTERRRYDKPDDRTERRRYDKPEAGSKNRRFEKSESGSGVRRFGKSADGNERRSYDRPEEHKVFRKSGRFNDGNDRKNSRGFEGGSERNRYERYDKRDENRKPFRSGDWYEGQQETDEAPFVTFASLLIGNQDRRAHTGIDVEPLAELSYEEELKKKNEAIKKFWKEHELPVKPDSIVPSPKPRNYRTTTKRRVIRVKNRFQLAFSTDLKKVSNELFVPSPLETDEHSAIYNYIAGRINEPVYHGVGSALNFVIIRGSYSEFSVIFNVHILTGQVVRKLKALAEEISEREPMLISAFIYLDPSRSDYYLESFRPQDQMSFKKLFGPDKLFVRFEERTYSFHPTGFSQVNQSMIPVMVKKAKDLLLPAESSTFIDLYCGYGLFALYMADYFEETIGIEAEGNSIRSAIENKDHIKTKGKVRFTAKRITAESIEDVLPENYSTEIYLLDPPRQGTEKGVIKKIAQRMPEKVIHIFCNVDKIPEEVKEWKKNNYMIQKVVPLDMFPGTPNLEVMILLKRR